MYTHYGRTGLKVVCVCVCVQLGESGIFAVLLNTSGYVHLDHFNLNKLAKSLPLESSGEGVCVSGRLFAPWCV